MEEQWQAERMRLAFRIAQDIQANLYPTKPTTCPAFDIEGASQPAEGVGGDYFDYFPFPDGSLAIAIGDVTGHGVGPALLMAATRAYVRALALSHCDVGEILMLANRALAADITDGRFVTLLLARLDPTEQSLVFAGAGHPAGYILARDGSVKARMDSNHLPLGVLDEQNFSASRAITLDPGDAIVMLTDGVAEAKDGAGALFGEQRAIDFIRGHLDQPARQIVAALGEQVRRYSGRSTPEDDVTALVVKVKADFRRAQRL
jgi:sigma-B regulation protein RsbU (phosphoserine phosphatase)